ncbi:Protein roadkill [Frankliniella fusca]|uniref:Protein roadkill n=1 Tax=Frankliniella fusca TaxID=407009 RepID=A0AAE1HU28_9NEOP|nr:Protein roadkill [Frankliniella fusca]
MMTHKFQVRYSIPVTFGRGIHSDVIPDIEIRLKNQILKMVFQFDVSLEPDNYKRFKGYCVMHELYGKAKSAAWGAHFYCRDNSEDVIEGALDFKERVFNLRYGWINEAFPDFHSNELDLIFILEFEEKQEAPMVECKRLPGASSAALTQSFGSLLQSGLLSDVKLCTDGQEIPAHKAILAARSKFFKAKFKPEWNGETVMLDVPHSVLTEMLRYIHTGSFGEGVDVIDLLVAADMYLVTDLCDEIIGQLEEGLKLGKPISSVCDMLKTSVTHNTKSLRSVVLKYISNHLEEVLKSKEWNEFQKVNQQVAVDAILDIWKISDYMPPPPLALALVTLAGALETLLLAPGVPGAAAARRSSSDGTHLEVRPKYVRPCPGEPNNAFESMAVDFEMRGRTSVVVMVNASITRSVDRWSKVRMTIEQCDQAVSASTCKPFKLVDFNDPCPLMMNPTMPWAKMVSDVRPKLACPIAKGKYRLINGTLSMDLLNTVGATWRLEGILWRARFHNYDSGGDLHICTDAAGEIFRLGAAPGAAAARTAGGTHLEVRPRFIRPCQGDHTNAISDVDVTYEFRGRTSVVMMANLTVTRSAERYTKGRVLIEQCDERVSASTCTPFRTFESAEVCGLMMNPAMPWSKVVTDVQPRVTCPMSPGNYHLSNGTISMELLNTVSATLRLEGYVWRFRGKTLDEHGDTHLCIDLAGEFFRVRNRPAQG